MKKQMIGIFLSVFLVSQPVMAAHLSILSWKDAEESDKSWRKKLFSGKDSSLSKQSSAVLQGSLDKVRSTFIADPGSSCSGYDDSIKKSVMDALGAGKNKDKVTPLHYAAAKNNTKVIEYLLQQIKCASPGDMGLFLNAQDSYGRTPLMWAVAEHDHIESVQLLIQAGADLTIRDNVGRTVMHWAIYNVRLSIVAMLIEEIEKKYGKEMLIKILRMQDNAGNTPLHYAVSIRYMLNNERVDPIVLVGGIVGAAGIGALSAGLAVGSGLLTASATAATTSAAALGVSYGGLGAVTTAGTAGIAGSGVVAGTATAGVGTYGGALSYGVGALVTTGATGSSAAVGGAAAGGTAAAGTTGAVAGASAAAIGLAVFAVIGAVAIGLTFGIPAAQEADDKDRRQNIHAQRNKIVSQLLEKDDTNVVTTAHEALISDIPALVTRNNDGRIPSHFAAIAGNPEPQTLLNNKAAAAQGTAAGLQYFKDGMQDLWNNVDNAGFTPLMYAVMRDKNENLGPSGLNSPYTWFLNGLLARNDPHAQGTVVTTDEGSFRFASNTNVTPLKLALCVSQGDMFDTLFKRVKNQDIYTDLSGRTVLHYAAMGGIRVKEIYTTYADIAWQTILDTTSHLGSGYRQTSDPMILAQDIMGATPIHYAAASSAQALQFLLNQLKARKKDNLDTILLNMRDKAGMTPLHYAALGGKKESVEALMNAISKNKKDDFASIKVNKRNSDGENVAAEIADKTAQDIAIEEGHAAIAKYLGKDRFDGDSDAGKKAKEAKKEQKKELKQAKKEDKKNE